MGIRDQVCLCSLARQQRAQRTPMLIRRMRDPARGAVQPFFDLLPGAFHCLRPLEDAGIACQADESQEARPGQADSRRSVQAAIQPISSCAMLGKGAHPGIDQEIGVYKDHR